MQTVYHCFIYIVLDKTFSMININLPSVGSRREIPWSWKMFLLRTENRVDKLQVF